MAIRQTTVVERAGVQSAVRDLVPGVLVLLQALPVALLIQLINHSLPDRPERAVQVVGVLFAILLALPPAVYLLVRRRAANPGRLGLIVLATVGVLLVSVYLYWVSFYVLFPADILIWSESDFVNDILKFRLGYPIYSAQVNNESFTYVPGSRLLTYFLASLSGRATSIPVYRMIQIGYTLLAAVIAAFCCRGLVEMSLSARRFRDRALWGAVWLPIFFLMATNSLTNPFVHNLHDDALAQLVSVTAYYLLLKYVSTRDDRVLAAMAVIPGLGFLVKQSLAIWAVLYCAQLALFDRPRSMKRLVTFAMIAFGGIGAVIAGCYALWGDNFVYWALTVLGKHGVSPLRSFQHILDAWIYFAIGLLGGVVLLRGKSFHLLLGPWLVWLSVFLMEAYTSGIAWMRNQMGPGSLIAGIWFIAALVKLWPSLPLGAISKFRPQVWLRVGIAVAAVGLLFSGLGVVRIPMRPFSSDAYRYLREIEREFEGQSADNLLLDAGTWIYLKQGVVMKDRAPSIGERGYSETGNFSGMIQRLKQKRYSKILIRNLHAPDFWYDHRMWRKPSEIKRTLLENYREIGRIMAVQDGYKQGHYLFSDISILVPNTN